MVEEDPLVIEETSSEDFSNEDYRKVQLINDGYLDPTVLEHRFVINSKIVFQQNCWKCKECDFKHELKVEIQNHVEEDHRPPGFPGYICTKCWVVNISWRQFVSHNTRFHSKNSMADWESILLESIYENLQLNIWLL